MKRVPVYFTKILTNSIEVHHLPPLSCVLDGPLIGGVLVSSQTAQDTVSMNGSYNHGSFNIKLCSFKITRIVLLKKNLYHLYARISRVGVLSFQSSLN